MSRSFDPLSDPRSRRLLRALIAQYIRDGQPVGSRSLARFSGLDVSPATIRNVMADLEEIGLVSAPHTSAGRVPTAQGYRVFVDRLLQLEPLDERQQDELQRQLQPEQGTQGLLSNVSSLLSAMTHFVGMVTVPTREQFALKQIDFVPIGPNRLLTVLVFADNEVQNRVIEVARNYTPAELSQISAFLNQHFAGLRLKEIHARLLRDLREARSAMDKLMSSAIEVAEAALTVDSGKDVLLTGQTNLMGGEGGLADMSRLRDLFDAFQQKRDLLSLLEGCIHAQGVRLFIGEESGFNALGQCSVVTAPYGANGQVLGVLGVIGPTRMAYEQVIPVVQATAQILGRALNQAQSAQ